MTSTHRRFAVADPQNSSGHDECLSRPSIIGHVREHGFVCTYSAVCVLMYTLARWSPIPSARNDTATKNASTASRPSCGETVAFGEKKKKGKSSTGVVHLPRNENCWKNESTKPTSRTRLRAEWPLGELIGFASNAIPRVLSNSRGVADVSSDRRTCDSAVVMRYAAAAASTTCGRDAAIIVKKRKWEKKKETKERIIDRKKILHTV